MRRIGAFAAFLTLLVAGCTSADGSGPSTAPASTLLSTPKTSVSIAPPPTVSTSAAAPTIPADVPRTGPNTKPGEQPPVMPVAATQHTAAGAEAFAEFFVKTIDWGYATTSSAYMRHYFSPSCEGCAIFADGLDKDHGVGDIYVGGRTSIVGVADPSHSSVIVTVDITSFEKTSSSGRFLTGEEAHTNLPFVVRLQWQPNGWRTTGLVVRT